MHTKVLIVILVLPFMQKSRLQILLDFETLRLIHDFMRAHALRNESQAIREMTLLLGRFQRIIDKLEKQAQAGALWKERAEAHLKPKEVEKLNTTTQDIAKDNSKQI